MKATPRSSSPATPSPVAAKEPRLIPCLLLRGGRVCLPGPDGPVAARTPSGEFFDPFDVVDRLTADHSLIYVVDLDGIEEGAAQLDYLQELSRDVHLWVDAGVRTGDQAIDVIVAGARRAVLSSAYLLGPKELKRAWRFSTEYLFEVEVSGGALTAAHASWGTRDPYELLRIVNEVGIDHFVVSPRGTDPDWSVVRTLTTMGPTYVNGTFTPDDAPRLAPAGAVGGIYHIDRLLADWNRTR